MQNLFCSVGRVNKYVSTMGFVRRLHRRVVVQSPFPLFPACSSARRDQGADSLFYFTYVCMYLFIYACVLHACVNVCMHVCMYVDVVLGISGTFVSSACSFSTGPDFPSAALAASCSSSTSVAASLMLTLATPIFKTITTDGHAIKQRYA